MTRDEIKGLLDEFSEDELFSAEMYLMVILQQRNSPQRDDALLSHFNTRAEQFRVSVEHRWHNTRKRGTISGLGGGGSLRFDQLGQVNGEFAYQYSDGKSLVLEKLRVFVNQEVQSTERFSISEDETQLLYGQDLHSGGRAVSSQEAFPLNRAEIPFA